MENAAAHKRAADRRKRDSTAGGKAELTQDDYRKLAEFRYALRKFLAFSESAAADVGMTTQQYQALLALKGFSEAGALSMKNLADRLLLRHHSVVELVDRLVKLDLVTRLPDPDDGRRVLIALTKLGESQLRTLAAAHLRELPAIGSTLSILLDELRSE